MFGPPQVEEWEGNMRSFSGTRNETSNENEQSELSRMLFDFSFPDVMCISEHDRIPSGITIRIEYDTSLKDVHSVLRSIFINGRRTNDPEISHLLTHELWNYYVSLSLPLINKYVVVMTDKLKDIYVSDKREETYEDVKYRINLIMNYIRIVESLNIMTINYYHAHETSSVCPSCGIDVFNVLDPNVDGRLICQCGFVIEDPVMAEDQIEVAEGTIVKPSVDILNAFNKWLNRYLCNSNEKYTEADYLEIFRLFDERCVIENWPSGDDVRSERVQQPELKMLTSLMAKINKSELYKIKNIIRHKYWGWPKPVLSDEQKIQIKRYYIAFQTAYPSFAKRKQKISSEINGYQLLRAVGHTCYLVDFKIPDTAKTISDANEVSEQVCAHIKIPFFKAEI
jgi:hypothetical protein